MRHLPSYLAGTVYPDSRYVTGLSRKETHGLRQLTPESTDFEKGWFTHILYDQLVGPCYLRESLYKDEPVRGLSEAWIHMSAAKLLEDLQSCAVIPHRELFLSMEAPAVSPCGEQPEALRSYYALLQTLYQRIPSIEDYRLLFDAFHLPQPVADALVAQTRQLLQNDVVCQHIATFYLPALQNGLARVQEPHPQAFSD